MDCMRSCFINRQTNKYDSTVIHRPRSSTTCKQSRGRLRSGIFISEWPGVSYVKVYVTNQLGRHWGQSGGGRKPPIRSTQGQGAGSLSIPGQASYRHVTWDKAGPSPFVCNVPSCEWRTVSAWQVPSLVWSLGLGSKSRGRCVGTVPVLCRGRISRIPP